MVARPLLIAVSMALAAGVAFADDGRVVLSDPSPTLAQGVRDALEPWGLQVEVVDASAPGAAMPQNAASARSIARRHDAQAVVWVAGSGTEYAVWVYDADADQVVSRALKSPPPFDDATAAAVGLTVRVLMRHVEVAPPEERFGATLETRTLRRATPSRLWFHATSGVRVRPTEASDAEPRLGLGVAVYPTSLSPFGAQLLFRTGPGISINDPAFVGHFSDLAVSAGVAARFALTDSLVATPAAGAGLHFTRLDGLVTTSDVTPDVRRANLHLEVGGQLDYRIGGMLHLGLRFDVAYAARRQTYLVGGVPVLDLPSAEAEGSLIISLPFL